MGGEHQDCGSPEHGLHRRRFLEGLTAGAISTFSWSGLFSNPVFAETAKKKQKRCILLWLCGGPSQFETWDPKPGTPTSGPFGSIPTSIPGVHFSELMPKCASIAHKTAVIRSMKTSAREHSQAINLLQRGHKPRPPFTRPTLGSVLSRQLGQLGSALPNFILLDPCPEGNEFKGFKAGNWAGWLGAEYAPVRTGGEFGIPHVNKLDSITTGDHEAREELRSFFSKKFENDTRSEAASSHNAVYERVKGLMSCAHLFDLERLPRKDRERYGPGTFGQHTLLARTLVEEGAPFVMVANGMPWDCHVFNHEIYQMVVPDLDNILFQRTMNFFGDPELSNYVLEADVATDGNRRVRSTIGLVNQRYLITLDGNRRILEVSSNHERVKESVKFSIQPNTWYHLKTHVMRGEDGKGSVRAKAWIRDQPEPAEWTIEVKLDDVHEKGAPGIFAFSPQVQKRVYIDNIKLSTAR